MGAFLNLDKNELLSMCDRCLAIYEKNGHYIMEDELCERCLPKKLGYLDTLLGEAIPEEPCGN